MIASRPLTASARYLESFALEIYLTFQRILYSSKSWSSVLRRCLRRTEADVGVRRRSSLLEGRARQHRDSQEGDGADSLLPSFLRLLELAPTGTFATRLGRVGIKLPFTLQPGTSATRGTLYSLLEERALQGRSGAYQMPRRAYQVRARSLPGIRANIVSYAFYMALIRRQRCTWYTVSERTLSTR
jgi:hypothetical protein